MRALVAYASKTGFTKGIAEFIGEKLQARGVLTDVQDVGTIRDIKSYDAFVIGSAVYMFHWQKEAKQFVSRNQALLAAKPVWLFSSGPVGRKTTDAQGRDLREVSGPKEIDELKDQVRPRDHHVFYGGLDGARLSGTMGFAYRMARRSQSAREAMSEGDFRDWKEIEAWANGIAESLTTGH